jgi:hypothetical protein
VSQRWLAEQAAQAAPVIPHWPFDWLAVATQLVPLQQPFGHEVALHTHAPPAEQVVPPGQAVQEPPFIPQVAADGGEWHCRLPSQQPPAHDDELHAHMPFAHVCPAAHAAQAAPPIPQVPLLEVRHMPPESQQPFAHEDALQTQAPALPQACPVAHDLQAAPPIPQVPLAEARHWPPVSQQPFGQEDALHTHMPFAQVWPLAHAAHAIPLVPQVVLPEVRHWPPVSQQPFGHDAGVQTQAPCALHAWLAPHATHCPPLAPQAEADAVMHWPFAQQPAQLMLPQLQPPLLHVCPDAHMPQAFPPEPHAVVDCADCATQRACESQQPFAHEVGLHTQVPAGPQVCPAAQAPHAAPAVPHAVVDCVA